MDAFDRIVDWAVKIVAPSMSPKFTFTEIHAACTRLVVVLANMLTLISIFLISLLLSVSVHFIIGLIVFVATKLIFNSKPSLHYNTWLRCFLTSNALFVTMLLMATIHKSLVISMLMCFVYGIILRRDGHVPKDSSRD